MLSLPLLDHPLPNGDHLSMMCPKWLLNTYTLSPGCTVHWVGATWLGSASPVAIPLRISTMVPSHFPSLLLTFISLTYIGPLTYSPPSPV